MQDIFHISHSHRHIHRYILLVIEACSPTIQAHYPQDQLIVSHLLVTHPGTLPSGSVDPARNVFYLYLLQYI